MEVKEGKKEAGKKRRKRILSFKYLWKADHNWFQVRKGQNSVLSSPISPDLKEL